jgi:hypothetical protein
LQRYPVARAQKPKPDALMIPVSHPTSLRSTWNEPFHRADLDVFDLATMEESLSKNAFKAMTETVRTGAPLDPAIADIGAATMKEWAMSKGVKFFSHIFYPMTKHRSREARRVHRHELGRQCHHRVHREPPDQGRARRVVVPERQSAHDQRRPRQHGMGFDESSRRHAHRERRHADDPQCVLLLDGELDKKIPLLRSLVAALDVHDFESTADHMQHCATTVRDHMDAVRALADALETVIADEYWPLPKYREMLFIK